MPAMLLPLVITMEAVRAMLDRTLLDIMEAGVFLAIGFGVTVLYRLRARKRDRALLWFGLFSLLYGVRLLAVSEAFRDAFNLSEIYWRYLASEITYVITLPILLLLWEIFPTWRKVLRILSWGVAAFALVGLASDAIQKRPESISTTNNVLVLLALGYFLFALFRQLGSTPDVKALRAGVLFFSFTIAVNNTWSLFNHRMPFNPEPIGLLAMLVSLGRVLAGRAYRDQERLVELDQELSIARRIQMSILPREMPVGPHWDIDARYVPMTAVAGDFYDFFPVDEQRIGVLIADVSGHGVPAALIASMVKIAFAAEQPNAASPSQVLCGINRTLCGKLQGQYVTAAYLYLDFGKEIMRYSAAAHPALLWSRADGRVEELLENGLMLGLFSHAEYTERECAFHRGDRFLLYTDGLLEAANNTGEFFGEARAKDLIEKAQSQSVQSLVATFVDRVAAWSSAAQDDLTIIAIASQPHGAT